MTRPINILLLKYQKTESVIIRSYPQEEEKEGTKRYGSECSRGCVRLHLYICIAPSLSLHFPCYDGFHLIVTKIVVRRYCNPVIPFGFMEIFLVRSGRTGESLG